MSATPPLPDATVYECDLTPTDYRAWRRFVLYRLRKVHWVYVGLLMPFLILTWRGARPEDSTRDKVATMIGFVVLWLVLMGALTAIIKAITRFTTRNRDVLGRHTWEISPAAVIETNAHGRTETRLSGLRRVYETRKHFFILNANNTGTIIPKHCVTNANALHELQNQLTTN